MLYNLFMHNTCRPNQVDPQQCAARYHGCPAQHPRRAAGTTTIPQQPIHHTRPPTGAAARQRRTVTPGAHHRTRRHPLLHICCIAPRQSPPCHWQPRRHAAHVGLAHARDRRVNKKRTRWCHQRHCRLRRSWRRGCVRCTCCTNQQHHDACMHDTTMAIGWQPWRVRSRHGRRRRLRACVGPALHGCARGIAAARQRQ